MSSFVLGRYPYTYAYDYLRGETHASVSRGDMAVIVKRIAEAMDTLPAEICEKLADNYLVKFDIQKPKEYGTIKLKASNIGFQWPNSD